MITDSKGRPRNYSNKLDLGPLKMETSKIRIVIFKIYNIFPIFGPKLPTLSKV